jgi:hypothetical protein
MDLSVVTVLPSLSAVGSWEKVLLFSMDITVSQNFLELELQDANVCLKKLAFAFLTDCVYWFLTSLNSCMSRGLFDAIAVRQWVNKTGEWKTQSCSKKTETPRNKINTFLDDPTWWFCCCKHKGLTCHCSHYGSLNISRHTGLKCFSLS